MASAAALLNHQSAAQALRTAAPMANSTSGTSGTSGSSDSSDSSTGSATISANDFLTLLVTEMQNQDPTADTDPNEYIDQLVQVNSLEQLIDINQTLSSALGASSSTTTGDGAAAPQSASGTVKPEASAAPSASPSASGPLAGRLPGAAQVSGNLSVPSASAAAGRVGHALDGRTPARPAI